MTFNQSDMKFWYFPHIQETNWEGKMILHIKGYNNQ